MDDLLTEVPERYLCDLEARVIGLAIENEDLKEDQKVMAHTLYRYKIALCFMASLFISLFVGIVSR